MKDILHMGWNIVGRRRDVLEIVCLCQPFFCYSDREMDGVDAIDFQALISSEFRSG
jgi:hypothetical protein